MTSGDLHATLAKLQEKLSRIPEVDEASRQLLQQAMRDAHAAGGQPSATAPVDHPGLEAMAVRFDTEHPDLSAGIRQFLDVLTKGGL